MGKTKTAPKIPCLNAKSIHELESDIPLYRRNDVIDFLAYLLFAFSGLAVYKNIGWLLWLCFFSLISLILNRRYRSGILPPPYLMLAFNCFLIYVFYQILYFGFG